MHVSRARFLVSSRARSALDAIPRAFEDLPPHRLATELRRSFPSDEASALAEQVMLRAKARGGWGRDPRMLLTAEGLEMMTHPDVAARRAARFAALGLPVADLTCGLGGDLRAIAATGALAAGIERDEATALLASANTGGRAVQGDACSAPVRLDRRAVFMDPSRRSASGRRFDPGSFAPPWEAAVALAREARAAALKGPPGIPGSAIPAGAEAEFVQLGRSLREACFWFGAGARAGLRRAVLLDHLCELDSTTPEAAAEPIAPSHFLFDPESCVTRAGLVRQLAAILAARLMDPQVAYLTAEAPAFHPMAATFEVLETLPFSVGRLKALLRERGWRADEIRRRAFPIEPDELRRLLGRLDGERVTLLCTTIAGKRTVFVARRLHQEVPALNC